jgi:exodeoxyribonuclease-3
MLARGTDSILRCKGIPASGSDTQARYIEAAVNGVFIASIDLSSGNPNPGPKCEYKLAWFEGLIERAAKPTEAHAPVVIAGDFNVVPTEVDIYQPNRWRGDALVDPKARFAFRRLLEQWWTDALRAAHLEGPLWTFWAYLRNRWPTNKGLRLDHLLVSPTFADTLAGAGVDRDVSGREGASCLA